MLQKGRAKPTASSRDLICFQFEEASGSAVLEMFRNAQSIMNLRLFESRSLVLTQKMRTFCTFVYDAVRANHIGKMSTRVAVAQLSANGRTTGKQCVL